MKIKIRYEPGRYWGLRWHRPPAYSWYCQGCGIRGRNAFNRFTDRAHPEKYVHPWRRCMKAAYLHIWKHHS